MSTQQPPPKDSKDFDPRELNAFLQRAYQTIVPVGGIIVYGKTTAPAGWLKCDGAAVARIKYSVLFSIIGTVFGTGDGSTTFNVPTIAAVVSNTIYMIRH